MERFFTTKELAEELGWRQDEVAQLCREGLIKAEKQSGRWRIPEEEARRLLATGEIDRKILRVELAIRRSRFMRIISGKATARDWFWFTLGFGRGRYARGRFLILSLYLAYLKLKRRVLEVISKVPSSI